MDARVMLFGKHKGERIDELDSGYLRWMIENVKDDELAEFAREVLRRRDEDEE